MDRLDLHIGLKAVDPASLSMAPGRDDTSAAVAVRVQRAREIQAERQKTLNAYLDNTAIHQYCLPDKEGQRILEGAMKRFGLSARAYHRILKVARTIADLDGTAAVSGLHVGEAVMYRQLDRNVQVDVNMPARSYSGPALLEGNTSPGGIADNSSVKAKYRVRETVEPGG